MNKLIQRIREGGDYTAYAIGYDWGTFENWKYPVAQRAGKEFRLVINIWRWTFAFHFQHRYKIKN